MRSFRIAVITSLFNEEITLRLEKGALDYLAAQGMGDNDLVVLRVPGAFELPLAAKWAIKKKKVDGVVALGAVIKGETDHYTYVCEAAQQGCLQVSLKHLKPVGFGVLTTENAEQAVARAGGSHGNKGEETAKAVLEMCDILNAST